MRLSRPLRQVLWIIAVALLVAIFAVAGRGDGTPPTNEERVAALAAEFACPECSGQSVAQSNAPAARNIERAVTELVNEGATDEQIRARITDRFGERVSLVPASDGVVGLVWVIPVVVALLAVAAIIGVLVRWRRGIGAEGAATQADRALVDEFLAERRELTEVDLP